MPSPTPFNPKFIPFIPSVAEKPEHRRRRGQRKIQKAPGPSATVSQATRDRLIQEACRHPAFEGMEESEIAAFVNDRINRFLVPYPFWYGHTEAADTAARRQRRRYQVQHGQIEKQALPAGLAAWRRRQRELCLEENDARSPDGPLVSACIDGSEREGGVA